MRVHFNGSLRRLHDVQGVARIIADRIMRRHRFPLRIPQHVLVARLTNAILMMLRELDVRDPRIT